MQGDTREEKNDRLRSRTLPYQYGVRSSVRTSSRNLGRNVRYNSIGHVRIALLVFPYTQHNRLVLLHLDNDCLGICCTNVQCSIKLALIVPLRWKRLLIIEFILRRIVSIPLVSSLKEAT